MAKQEEIKVVKEDEFSKVVVKPIYTGAKDARKKIGEFQTVVLKGGLTPAQLAKWVESQDPADVVASYNYGKDLRDRGEASPARPGMETSVVKTKAFGEIDLLKMPDLPGKPGSGKAKAIAMCEAALAYAKQNGATVPKAYAFAYAKLTAK